MKRILIPLLILTLCATAIVFARDMKRLKRNIEADRKIKNIRLESDIGAARFNITTHEGGDIFETSVRYNSDKIKSEIDFEKSGSSAELFLSSSRRRKSYDVDSDHNRWKTSLSTAYEWDINLDIGFAESRIDLSGLPLENFSLDIGASEMRVEFDRPNPIILRRFTVNAGAGEIELIGLGYSNFERFNFDGGAGEFYIDFTGMTDGWHRASIEAGVGELRIHLPEDFPVRIDIDDSWLSSVEVIGNNLDEIDDNLFESDDFKEGKNGLEIDLDIGIGSVIIAYGDDPSKKIMYRSTKRYGQNRSVPHGTRNLFSNWINFFDSPVISAPTIPVLPNIPTLPELPTFSAVPAMPSLPAMPTMPAMPTLVPLSDLTPLAPIAPLAPLQEIYHNSERSRRKVE